MSHNKLRTPDWIWTQKNTSNELVHEWVRALTPGETKPNVIVYGVPLSKASISVSGASLYPDAFRRMWKNFSTYNIEEEIDLSTLKVCDAGNVEMHTTDLSQSHEHVTQATSYLVRNYPNTTTCMFGGDHSVTAFALKGLKSIYHNQKIGLLQLDTHLDVRDPKIYGPANGTPIRILLEEGIVEGKHIINIGPHGYYNTKSIVEYARAKEIQIVSLQKARTQGLTPTILQSLAYLKEHVDVIYVTVDMDVVDIAFAPGVPASTTGGMTSREFLAILMQIGKERAVQHIDFVCQDPTKDSPVQETVKLGVHAWMNFMTGRMLMSE